MKTAEKQRLTQLVREATDSLSVTHPLVRDRLQRLAAKYSPTSFARFNEFADMVWWLIALNERDDAFRLLDALCEVDDDYYWMFEWMNYTFATRAWLHARARRPAKSAADAATAAAWLERDPNAKPVTRKQIRKCVKRATERIHSDNTIGITTARVLSNALDLLVFCQQLAHTGCKAAQTVPIAEYDSLIEEGLTRLSKELKSL